MKQVLILISILFTAIPCFTQSIPSYIPSDGLIGWWPFNGNANDESGNGNDGTVNGAVLTEDRFGNANSAYSFDGIDDFIQVENSNSLSQNINEITISAWYNISDWYINPVWGSQNFPILCKGNSAGNFGQYSLIVIQNYIAAYVNQVGAQIETNTLIQDWINLSAVIKNTTTEFYLNGVLIEEVPTTNQGGGIGSFNYIEPLIIGKDIPGQTECANGIIDDIGIWNRALTANEIQSLYNSNLNTSTCNPLPNNLQNGLVGYWPFCGNANDESGNGNDGTVNGAVLTEDRFGNVNSAYSFDGNSQGIYTTDLLAPWCTTALSASLWFAPNEGFNENARHDLIASDYFSSANTSTLIPFQIYYSNGVIGLELCSQNGIVSFYSVPLTNISVNEWYNIAFSAEVSSIVTIYINGVAFNVGTAPNSFSSGNVRTTFGYEVSFLGPFSLNGKIDDVGIWNRALTNVEIISIYSNINCNSIIEQSEFSSCSGTPLTVSAGNFSIDTTTSYSIGDTGPAGGIIFFDKGNNNDGWRYLEAATTDLNQATWGCNGIVLQNTNGVAIGTGLENTNNIVAQCSENNIAAKLCFDFISNGYDDWFLPSRDELFQLYLNRSMVGGFNPSGYWTSTQQPVPVPLPDYAYFQSFEDVPVCCNGLYNTGKNQLLRVRPIRRVSETIQPSYLWSTGETTPSITVSPTETTTYTLTVTQGSQTCTDQVTVTVIPSPTVELTTNSPVIAGANLQLNASATPGTTFQWTGPNNFTSTEQNPVVTNSNAFNAGTYSVTPTLNGCQGVTVSTNVQIIPSDNVLTLYMDTVPGINGQETLVNMRVRNFTNMLSAQFTLQFDPSVVSYLGFTNPAVSSITGNSFGQIQIANGILTFAWSQPNVIPVSLSDGTVLFSLRFQPVGSGGTSTPVQFVNTPTPLEFVDQSFIPLNSWIVNPGRIEILNLATISGSLTLPNGVGIRSATISASGFSNQSTQSALDGSYSINLAEGQSYSITPSKGNDTLVANGITTLDVILIQRHILGTLLLNSPYKIIAADVNLSGTITSADINFINALILANINQYPSGLFWSFVPDDYSFPNPVNPFPFPSSRNYPSLSGTVNENYIGVKLGDVNYTYNNALARLSAATDSVNLFIEDQIVQEGAIINVPVKVKNFSNMAGFQLALEWDPQVISFNDVNSNNGGLAVNIGATQANSGLLNINWIEPNSSVATIQDDSALFVITFEVIGEVGTNSAINIVSSPTAPIELINENLEIANYGIENGNILVNIPSGITNNFGNTMTVFPNPASNFIQINCESCIQENKYTVHLYNSIGQLAHKQEIVSFPASISIGNSISTGLYFLMLEERESGSRFVKKVQIKNH